MYEQSFFFNEWQNENCVQRGGGRVVILNLLTKCDQLHAPHIVYWTGIKMSFLF